MTNSHKKPLPKYMDMEGLTRYELAQSIDAALHAAEQTLAQGHKGQCFQMWSDQLVDQLQDEFSFVADVKSVDQANELCSQMEHLFERCQLQFKLLMRDKATRACFQLALKGVLDRSLMGTIDLMHAQSIWRFDMQRQMQKTQVRLIELVDNQGF